MYDPEQFGNEDYADGYNDGIKDGWDLALAKYGIKEEEA